MTVARSRLNEATRNCAGMARRDVGHTMVAGSAVVVTTVSSFLR